MNPRVCPSLAYLIRDNLDSEGELSNEGRHRIHRLAELRGSIQSKLLHAACLIYSCHPRRITSSVLIQPIATNSEQMSSQAGANWPPKQRHQHEVSQDALVQGEIQNKKKSKKKNKKKKAQQITHQHTPQNAHHRRWKRVRILLGLLHALKRLLTLLASALELDLEICTRCSHVCSYGRYANGNSSRFIFTQLQRPFPPH